jgi:hypothetical protein
LRPCSSHCVLWPHLFLGFALVFLFSQNFFLQILLLISPFPFQCQQLKVSTTCALPRPPHTLTYAGGPMYVGVPSMGGAKYGMRVARQSRTKTHSSTLLIGICALAPNDDSPSDQERPLVRRQLSPSTPSARLLRESPETCWFPCERICGRSD